MGEQEEGNLIFMKFVKVRPHYAAWHTAVKCGKAAGQKLHHATSICGRCVGLAAACHSMLRGLKFDRQIVGPIKRSRTAYDE